MLCRLARFYGGGFDTWARTPIDVAVEAHHNCQLIASEESAVGVLIHHSSDPAAMLSEFRDRAEFVPDDEDAEAHNKRMRDKEAAMLMSLSGLQDNRR